MKKIIDLLLGNIISIYDRVVSFIKRKPEIKIYFDERQDKTIKAALVLDIWLENNSSKDHNVCSFEAYSKGNPEYKIRVGYPDEKYKVPFNIEHDKPAMFFEFLMEFPDEISESTQDITLVLSILSQFKGEKYRAGYTEIILNRQ